MLHSTQLSDQLDYRSLQPLASTFKTAIASLVRFPGTALGCSGFEDAKLRTCKLDELL